MFIKCKKLSGMSSSCLQGHVRKAQALVSLGRTEEALREYLVCLSLEPDCRLAKTEAHKVNTTSKFNFTICLSQLSPLKRPYCHISQVYISYYLLLTS